jgi:RHS repeat-associated protein
VAKYVYDGDGHRIKKVTSTATITYVYNAGGQLSAEFGGPPPSVGGTSYLTTDHLGSTRVVTDATQAVLSRHDYFPFGEEIISALGNRSSDATYTVVSGPTQRFTAKERDNESGLDYFGARYFSGAEGRFTSPDEFTGGPDDVFTLADTGDPLFYANLHNPQSLNKYQYCYNNPLRYNDPDGHETEAEKKAKEAAAAAASAAGTGAQASHDAAGRVDYTKAAQGSLKDKGEGHSVVRQGAKIETRNNMSPIGQSVSEAAAESRPLSTGLGNAKGTSQLWNNVAEGAGKAGNALVVVGAATSAVAVVTAPEGQKGREAAGQAGSWAFGIPGAIAGAKLGAGIGALVGGPPGAA